MGSYTLKQTDLGQNEGTVGSLCGQRTLWPQAPPPARTLPPLSPCGRGAQQAAPT